MTVTPGGGVNGSERVEFTWANNAIQDQWLQVTVAADSDTGLASPYVFYFGNAIGSTGDNPSSAAVNTADVYLTLTSLSGLNKVPITNDYDFNRDGHVNVLDVGIALNGISGLHPLKLITVPASSSAQLLVVSQDTMVPATEEGGVLCRRLWQRRGQSWLCTHRRSPIWRFGCRCCGCPALPRAKSLPATMPWSY